MENRTYNSKHEVTNLPANIVESYDVLRNGDMQQVETYAPTVPAIPDTTFTILKEGENLYALVRTDHPSPMTDSKDFYKLSSSYKFVNLFIPNKTSEVVTVKGDDEMEADFFVKHDDTYYYLANVIDTSKA